MAELERALVELGRELEYPPPPDLAAAVRLRLQEPPRAQRLRRRRLLVIALAVLAVAVGAVMAIPQARTAVLEWLGLRGVAVERVPTLPEVEATAPVVVGERVTLEQARRRAQREILLPQLEGLRAPDAIYVDPNRPGRPVTLVYGSIEKPRLLIVQLAGQSIAEKLLGPDTRVTRETVDGRNAIWIEGPEHVFLYRTATGDVDQDTQRLAGNTLLWERGRLTLRLEADISRDDALRIARSVR